MNNDNTKNKLFQNFSPSTKEEWMERVTVDLKGADFDKRLVWKNLNGINVQPFYTKEDKRNFVNNTGLNAGSVINYRRINPQDAESANSFALKAVAEGITGLIFEIDQNVSPEKLLNNIDVESVVVSFILLRDDLAFADGYKAFLSRKNIDPKKLKGFIDLNFLNNYLTTGKLDKNKFVLLSRLIEMYKDYPEFKSISISGTNYLDSGSNQVQEIAYTLNSLVFIIEELSLSKVSTQLIFDNLHITIGISSDYFIEIAKLRAFNSLLNKIAEKYQIKDFVANITSKTSIWSKSVTDAHSNMLRSTTEAMSAMLGNATAIEIDPYDHTFGESNEFSNRIAGNIITILREESYFGKVANPVDGSYYVEELTLQLAEKSLALFKDIEEKGGFHKQFENEYIQDQIAVIRFSKIKLLTQRRQAMVGVNKYPNLMESISKDLLSGIDLTNESNPKLLKPRRAGLELEQIRSNTETFVEDKGFRPLVEIASFGHLGMRKARAAFAYDFMGVSAYKMADEQSYASALEAAEKSAVSKSDIVVLCSSDQDYQDNALDFIKTFRALNQSKIVLLAGNPDTIQDDLLKAGLNGFIHMRSDIFKTLIEIQQKLSKTIKPLEI